MIMSYLELPSKGLGRRKMLLGLVVDDRKKIWEEHMEKLMNIEMNGVIALMLVR